MKIAFQNGEKVAFQKGGMAPKAYFQNKNMTAEALPIGMRQGHPLPSLFPQCSQTVLGDL